MRNELRAAAPRIVVAAVVAILVVAAGLMLSAVPAAGAAEVRLDLFLAAHVPPVGARGAKYLGAVLEPGGGVVLVGVCGALVWWRQDSWHAVRFTAVAAIGWLSVEPVKLLVHRPRPVVPGVHAAVKSWSYPSGHVALVSAVVIGLMLVSAGKQRLATAIVGLVAVLVVAASRLTLEVHFPSDTVASMIWVGAVTVVVASAFRVLDVARANRLAVRHRMAVSSVSTQPIIIERTDSD